MRALRSLLSRLGTAPQPLPPAPLPQPDTPVCIIGDVHGRRDLLEALLEQIDTRAAGQPFRLIFVGDLVDRGPASADVLALVFARCQATPEQTLCLMGNHERMMLDFLADPAAHGPRWLRAGGGETLSSYGLSPWSTPKGIAPQDRLPAMAEALRTALPEGMEDWLTALPLIWQEGPLVVAHAALDPARAPEAQKDHTLIWGHPDFLKRARRDAIWVAHGHTIMEEAHAQDSRIAVDTGAWRSGRLSAAWLDQTGLSFIQATESTG